MMATKQPALSSPSDDFSDWRSDPIAKAPAAGSFWENDPVGWDHFPAADKLSGSDWDRFPRADAQASAPISANSLVRSTATGMPIIGGALNRLEAATNATLAPALNRFFDDKDQLKGGWSDRYAQSLAQQGGMDQKFAAAHPGIDTTAKIAGGVASTFPVAATATGARALGLVGNTLTKQAVAGSVSGAVLGATDAAVRGEDPERGAVTGGAFGVAGPAVARGATKIVQGVRNLISPPEALPSTETIKDAAKGLYDQIRTLDVRIKPEAVQNLAQEVRQKFQDQGFRDYLAPKTFGVINELAQPTPEGAFASFADLHGIRRALGKAAQSADPTEKNAASQAISALDDYLGNVPKGDVISGNANLASQLFKRANANYAAAKRSELLQGKVDAAELRAASANSGANLENALRQRVKDILKSPKLRQGFNDDELLLMQRVVRGTAPANMIRAVGNLLGGGGGLGSVVTGGGAMLATGSPVGLVAPAVGAAVKKIGNRMTEAQLAKLDEMIRSRAPASSAANAIRAALAARQAQGLVSAGQAGMLAGPAVAPAFVGQNGQ